MSLVVLVACSSTPVPEEAGIAARLGAGRIEALLWEGESQARFGSSVAAAGDLDGDGYGDVVVGAPGADGTTGAAWVYRGTTSGLDPAAVARYAEPFDPAAQEEYGASVDGAGDVNGDGYDDLVVGAPVYGGGEGRVFVYHGSATGPSATASVELTLAGNHQLGAKVVGLGDANGDGYDDVAVGDEDYCSCSSGGGGTQYPGSVHVFYGSPAGLPAAPSFTVTGLLGDGMGASLDALGDVDGDGYDDLAIGAPGTGEVEVYLGSASGYATTPDATLVGAPAQDSFGWQIAGLGDVNGDGHPDLGVADLDATVSVFLGGPGGVATAASQVLAMAAASGGVYGVGDLTGDGYDDVAVGVPYDGATSAGEVCLYAGSAAGLDTSACVAEVHGRRDWAHVGEQVAGLGDLDGDGAVEVAIAAPQAGAEFTNVGAVVVVEGR